MECLLYARHCVCCPYILSNHIWYGDSYHDLQVPAEETGTEKVGDLLRAAQLGRDVMGIFTPPGSS